MFIISMVSLHRPALYFIQSETFNVVAVYFSFYQATKLKLAKLNPLTAICCLLKWNVIVLTTEWFKPV